LAIISPGTQIFAYSRIYTDLASLKKDPTFDSSNMVVNFVVPPNVTENVVKECKELGFKKGTVS
jgi:hypothetical protein